MQSSKIDFLTKYNELLTSALNASNEFPDKLSEYIVEEFDFQAVVVCKIIEGTNLKILGKSASAKKSLIKNTQISCSVCTCLKSNTAQIQFNSQNDCEIQTSEYVIYEGCLYIQGSANEEVLIKVAKKTPFSKVDKENLEQIGSIIRNLYNIWAGNKGSVNASLSEIITNIAHELRTPTNSVMGFASLLNEDNLTPSQTEYVSTLKESAYNLLSLINDLIDIAKVDSGAIKETLSNVELSAFIDDILKLFADKIDKSKIEFIVN